VDINVGSGVGVGVGVKVDVGVFVKVGVIVGVFVKVGVGEINTSHSIILNLSQPSKVITLIPTDAEFSN
jgi:hypothetical protein